MTSPTTGTTLVPLEGANRGRTGWDNAEGTLDGGGGGDGYIVLSSSVDVPPPSASSTQTACAVRSLNMDAGFLCDGDLEGLPVHLLCYNIHPPTASVPSLLYFKETQ